MSTPASQAATVRRSRRRRAADARAGARYAGALRDRVRQRRLLHLLRARPRRWDRARPDAPRLRHQRPDLRRHLGDLRRRNCAFPGGRRLLQLRAARIQRARLIRSGMGADAQLHHHDRHLGVLRSSLPVDLLGTAAREPVGHRRRRRGRGVSRPAEHHRDPGGGPPQHRSRRDRLRDPAAARAARVRADLRSARRLLGQHPLGRGADVECLLARGSDRDDRLHRNRDGLQPGRGGP